MSGIGDGDDNIADAGRCDLEDGIAGSHINVPNGVQRDAAGVGQVRHVGDVIAVIVNFHDGSVGAIAAVKDIDIAQGIHRHANRFGNQIGRDVRRIGGKGINLTVDEIQ